jgi:hypothetical protein
MYCEAPLAATTEDARAVADAATRLPKQVFQAGLQGRANSLYRSPLPALRGGRRLSSCTSCGQVLAARRPVRRSIRIL